jgi:hypothetical protein
MTSRSSSSLPRRDRPGEVDADWLNYEDPAGRVTNVGASRAHARLPDGTTLHPLTAGRLSSGRPACSRRAPATQRRRPQDDRRRQKLTGDDRPFSGGACGCLANRPPHRSRWHGRRPDSGAGAVCAGASEGVSREPIKGWIVSPRIRFRHRMKTVRVIGVAKHCGVGSQPTVVGLPQSRRLRVPLFVSSHAYSCFVGAPQLLGVAFPSK